MTTGRLEAFSDGVFAIIITIMVLELKVPHGDTPSALLPMLPSFLAYAVSFVYVGIYWANHHHLFHAADRVTGGVLWANLHLLFWLSLVPVVTDWVGEHPRAPWPAAAYGVVLLLSALAWWAMQATLMCANGGRDSTLGRALRSDWKGKLSPALYVVSIALAFVRPWLAHSVNVCVAAMWLVPDRRIARQLAAERAGQAGV
jgi:uncharacterized membrane protein